MPNGCDSADFGVASNPERSKDVLRSGGNPIRQESYGESYKETRDGLRALFIFFVVIVGIGNGRRRIACRKAVLNGLIQAFFFAPAAFLRFPWFCSFGASMSNVRHRTPPGPRTSPIKLDVERDRGWAKPAKNPRSKDFCGTNPCVFRVLAPGDWNHPRRKPAPTRRQIVERLLTRDGGAGRRIQRVTTSRISESGSVQAEAPSRVSFLAPSFQ